MKSLKTDPAEPVNCKLCGRGFSSFRSLHLHLSKTEKTSPKSYYETFYPKYDLWNKKQIPFKNFADYESRRFIDKKSEFAFLIREENWNVSQEILQDQIEKILAKSFGKFPSYCEWRSSKLIRFDKLEEAGLLEKTFELFLKSGSAPKKNYFDFSFEIKESSYNILVDTREKMPLFDVEKTTLNVGDYTLESAGYNCVHVDRKSKADFIATMTGGWDRFERECEKAKETGVELVVLVESSFYDCFSFKPLNFTKQKVGGENAFSGVRRITRKFPNVQFLFVADRDEARKYLKIILNNKDIVQNYDLQFLYETKRI